MNKQTSRVLMILLNSPGQYYNYAELAEILSVSSRSVRNYIQSLMQFMNDIKFADMLQISEGGVTFTGTRKDISRILEEVVDTDFYLYRLSQEERSFMIILYLLLLDDYSNLAQLSEKFNVSRTTALKDMDKVKLYLEHYNIALDPFMKKGYRLLSGELKRRDMILKIIRSGTGNVNIYEKFLYNEWELEKNAALLKNILLDTEVLYGLEVSDTNFEEILLTLLIIVKRLGDGRQIEASENQQTFQNMSVYELAGHILNRISSCFRVPMNEAEMEYLASRLYDCQFHHQTIMQEGKDIRLHLALTGFLLKISEELHVPPFENDVTVEQLESHLRAIDKAHLGGRQIRNDYTEQMIEEYPQYFELICRHRSILESLLEYQYTRDDLAVILIYLIVMVEGFQSPDHLPEVIVVCHTGIGTANFLTKRLKNSFHIKILTVTSNHKLKELIGKCSCDLIISTVCLEPEPELWIKVSPMLNDEDILKLQKVFMDIRKCKNKAARLNAKKLPGDREKTPDSTIAAVLKAGHVLLDVRCPDWTGAIRTAAEPLLREGVIENRYVEEMIRSVQVNGAYFVYSPGVALIHAGPLDGVNSFGLTLMRLAPPVGFGHKLHDPVKYVICMAVKEKDHRLQPIMKLMDILSEPISIAELDQMTDAAALHRCLIEKEEEAYEKSEF